MINQIKEFNLSEKIQGLPNNEFVKVIDIYDVKEFIRLLKQETRDVGLMSFDFLRSTIDNLVGDKLI